MNSTLQNKKAGCCAQPSSSSSAPTGCSSSVLPRQPVDGRQGGLVYVVSSAAMGRGDDDLGWALLQTYVQTIEKVEPLPARILLYNGGVRLVAEESGALNALRSLQERGVQVLACGTCLDFFGLSSKIKVGRISNMHEIMSSVIGAEKVVSPF